MVLGTGTFKPARVSPLSKAITDTTKQTIDKMVILPARECVLHVNHSDSITGSFLEWRRFLAAVRQIKSFVNRCSRQVSDADHEKTARVSEFWLHEIKAQSFSFKLHAARRTDRIL